jgi:RND family efflux transporter MFP subunit
MLVSPGGNCTAAEAAVGQAEEGVALANVQLETVKQGPREQDIAQAQSAVAAAQQQLDLAKAPFIRQDFDAAQSQINAAAAALEIAKLNRDESIIKAPIDGIVSAKQGTVGMMVAPGATPIVSLISEEVQITFGAEESLVGQLSIGQPAILTVAAYPGETFTGRVAIIAPVADLTTRTFAITVYPEDPNHKLRPGMFADLALEVAPQS